MSEVKLPRDPIMRIMPLHAITSVYGTRGLRHRFDLETLAYSLDEQDILQGAADWVTELHSDHNRLREPYLNHILRVTSRVMSPHHYDVHDLDTAVAALFHDTPEDQYRKLAPDVIDKEAAKVASVNVIGGRYGPGVQEIVGALTNPEFDKTDPNWIYDYRDHVREALLAVPKSRPIKLSDGDDNGGGIFYSPADRLVHYASKYSLMTPVYREILGRSDTPLSPKAREAALERLETAADRFRTILDLSA